MHLPALTYVVIGDTKTDNHDSSIFLFDMAKDCPSFQVAILIRKQSHKGEKQWKP